MMLERLSPAGRILIYGACLVVVAAGMQATATLVSALVLSIVIATTLAPLLHRLLRLGLPAWLAVVVVLVPVLGLGALFVSYLLASLVQLNDNLPAYTARLSGWATALSMQFLGRPDGLTAVLPSIAPQPGQVVGWATRAVSGALQTTNDLLLALFILLYTCLEAERFPARLAAILGPASPVPARLKALAQGLRSYVVINGEIGLLVAALRTAVLWLLGVDFALLWGAWSLLLTYVPTVGYPLAVIPPTLMALIDRGPVAAAIVFVAYGVINTLVYNVIQPKWAGHSLDLSPLVVIVSLFFWGIILGAMGALLAVPLTMMLRTLLECSDQTHWLADLMRDNP